MKTGHGDVTPFVVGILRMRFSFELPFCGVPYSRWSSILTARLPLGLSTLNASLYCPGTV
jgi:hypothetical protein